jgi:hypothetical protein
MQGFSLLERLLWSATIVCYTVVVTKMAMSHLHLRYKWFFFYLLVRLGRSVVLTTLDRGTNAYGWFFVATEPVMWVFYVLVILELYALVLKNYPGIRSFGRWVLIGGLAVSAAVSAMSLFVDLSGAPARYPILLYVNVIQRGVITSLVIFLLVITSFLVWYPVPLARNVVYYCVGFSLYFLSSTMALLIRNITGYTVTRSLSTTLQVVHLACLVFWILALNRRGEHATVVLGRRWRPDHEEKLVAQLNAINQSLLKTAGK